jgi:hypothetical protein
MVGAIAAAKAIIIAGLAAAALLMAGERLYNGGTADSSTVGIDADADADAGAPADADASADLSSETDTRAAAGACLDNCLAPCAAVCADPQGLPPLDGAPAGTVAFSAAVAPEQSCDCLDANSSLASNTDAEAGDEGSASATSALQSSTGVTAVGESSTSGDGFINGEAAFGMVSN